MLNRSFHVFSKAQVAPSYIALLPTEILTEIFTLTLPSPDDDRELRYDALALKSPIVLTCICRVWREIALSMPQLWRSLEIYVSHNVRRHRSISPGIKNFFSNATGDRTLSLHAIFPRQGGFETTRMVSAVPWPRLAHLTLSDDPLLSPHSLLEVFSQCVQLVTCKITCVGFDQHDANPLPGFEDITLELTHLTSLTIDFNHLPMGSGPSALSFRRPTRISPLIEALSLPALETLVLRASTEGSDDPHLIPVLWAHQRSSRPPLRRLVLGRILFDTDHMVGLLRDMPDLKHLHLAGAVHRPHSYPALVRRLAYDSTLLHSNILPHLENLIIEDTFPAQSQEMLWASEAVILDTLESRRWNDNNYPHGQCGLTMLKKVAMFLESGHESPGKKRQINVDAVSRVTRLRTGGLKICYPTLQKLPSVDVGLLRVCAGMNPLNWALVLSDETNGDGDGEGWVDYL